MGIYRPKDITIYAIQHCPTGRIYVGRTNSLEQRLEAHFRSLRSGSHPNELMQSDYNEYGNDYEVFVLEVVEDSYPIKRDAEFKWMDKLNTGDKRIGYNYKDPHFKHSGIELPEIIPGVPTPNTVES